MNLKTHIKMDTKICLISKEPIINEICLPCNHSYEYEYLYEEIKQQKNRHKNYFKCPYCRSIYNSCIPYYEIENVDKLKNINIGQILNLLNCSQNNCKNPANHFKNGLFCWKHYTKSIIIVELCKGICLNGNPCKNKRKHDNYCNVHKIKEKQNETLIKNDENNQNETKIIKL
jgi:hypothetical protein